MQACKPPDTYWLPVASGLLAYVIEFVYCLLRAALLSDTDVIAG